MRRARIALRDAALLLAAAGAFAAPLACASKGKVKPEALPPAQVYEMATQKMARKKFLTARTLLQGILPRIPPDDRELLPKVQLAIADSYFKEGGLLNYGEALNGFRNFLSYFPQHDDADRAQFMVGMSLFKQVLAPDRDQALTLKAIDEFRKVEAAYPYSSFVEESRRTVDKCYDLLAEHERLIGWFYQRRKLWRAAAERYLFVVDRYPRFSKLNRMLLDLGVCLLRQGKRTEAEEIFSRLSREEPDGKLAGHARLELREFDRRHRTGDEKGGKAGDS